MRRMLIATMTAAALTGGIAAPATAAETSPTGRLQAASATTATLNAQRTATFTLASRYAKDAPRVSWRQKARNADTLSRSMRVSGISTQQRALAIARTQAGTKYRWGGTTPAGFDCSGFTRFSYAKAGKSLPRTAAAQHRATRRTNKPIPGDLVFYGGAAAHHVGIYVGNGKMIHSPRTGKAIQTAKISRGASYGTTR